jgi:hypothetical protein
MMRPTSLTSLRPISPGGRSGWPKETVMGDATFENFAADAFDATRFAAMIRKSVREGVEGTLAKVPGSADTRQEIRAAGERLGNSLVAHAEASKRPSALAACPPAPRMCEPCRRSTTRTHVPEASGPWLESACSPHAPSARKLRTHSPHRPPPRGWRDPGNPPWLGTLGAQSGHSRGLRDVSNTSKCPSCVARPG